jgi:hypothetical protein
MSHVINAKVMAAAAAAAGAGAGAGAMPLKPTTDP